MRLYILKRLLLFIPALLLVSLLVFAISKAVPGDPAERIAFNNDALSMDDQAYQKAAVQLGLDKPAFYLGLSALAVPDTLHHIIKKSHRNNLYGLINRYGNWPEIQEYYHSILELRNAISTIPDSLHNDNFIEIRRLTAQLFVQNKEEEIQRLSQLLTEEVKDQESFSLGIPISNSISEVQSSFSRVLAQQSIWKLYVPDLKWNGLDNQYHNWFTGFLKGNFGISFLDNRPVSRKIGEALWWTLIMSFSSLLIIFSISIPLGILLASKKNTRLDKYLSLFLFGLFSLPRFWVATLLLVFFTTAEYGQWLDIFPGPGLGELRNSAPFWDRFWERSSHLILPIFCLSFAGIAYVTRQIRGNVIDVLDQDFVRTARAKGVPEKTVLWRHAFRNALFPLISLIAMTLPGLLAGSVIIEYIFAIPGMGRLMFTSILEQDWPFVYTVLMFTALITMVSNLLGDVCYALADPRVGF